jgi:hypothetical protein
MKIEGGRGCPKIQRVQCGTAGGVRERVSPTGHHDPHPPKAFRLVETVPASRSRVPPCALMPPLQRKERIAFALTPYGVSRATIEAEPRAFHSFCLNDADGFKREGQRNGEKTC